MKFVKIIFEKYNLFISILLFNVIREISFSLFCFNKISFYIIIFTILNSFIAYIIISLFKRKYLVIIYYISLTLITLIQYLYYKYYRSYFGLWLFLKSFKAIQFSKNIFSMCLNNWAFILIIIIALIFFIYWTRHSHFTKNTKYHYLAIPILYIVAVLSLLVSGNGVDSAKNLYIYGEVRAKTLQTFGLSTTIRLDLQRLIFGVHEKKVSIKVNNKKYDVADYNILNIDFKDSNNAEIKEITNYLKNREPTEKNEMTGLLKDKNVIFILAESFSSIAIDKDLAPNIYKLKNEGFSFENYYSPIYPVATADAQYVYDNSLYPYGATNTLVDTNNNYFPYSIARILKNKGYGTYAYHDYLYDYYDRDKYYKNMGFETYKAVGNGLNINLKNGASDYEMAQASIDDYINNDHFYVHYLTMSGHYAYDNTNLVAKRNLAKLKDYNWSNSTKIYMATQIELDKMIGYIIERLEAVGKLNDTVIILAPDHYPHGLMIDEINEISSFERDETFSVHHSEFIIYNQDINDVKSPEIYLSDLDILPTMLNLFGIEYDSRLLMGKDVFGINDNYVVLGDRSMISSSFKYNSFNEYMEGNININKKDSLKKDVNEQHRISRLIMQNDYYRYLFNK